MIATLLPPSHPDRASIPTISALVSGVRSHVIRRLTKNYAHLIPAVLLRRALNDAAEMALGTGFPDLFFPVLAEEKVRIVSEFLDGTPPQRP